MEVAISSEGLGACARPDDADGESLKEKVKKLEEWVKEMYEWANTEDTRNAERLEHLEGLLGRTTPINPRRETIVPRDRKQLLEHKAIQNVAQLGEDKHTFKEWNIKFANCMGQVDSKYEKALETIMKWAVAEVMPDMESGWPGNSSLFDGVPGLDAIKLDKDLKCVF